MRRDEFPIVEEYCKDKVVAELEKVKEEIENLTYYWCEVNPNSVKDDVIEKINKHISELKGENK